MQITPCQAVPEVLLLQPQIHRDGRGFFMETFRSTWFRDRGLDLDFVQHNHSRSSRGVLRGLHLQRFQTQAKLVRVLRGAVQDVAVDARPDSPTVGRWVAEELDAESGRQLFVPAGFIHGFLVLSEEAEVEYKCSDYYHRDSEVSVRWDDPELGIPWSLAPGERPVLTQKDDAGAIGFRDLLSLPAYSPG